MKTITMAMLNSMSQGDILAHGTLEDNGLFYPETGQTLRWLAIRGFVNDWAIYTAQPTGDGWQDMLWTDYEISTEGTKLPKSMVEQLVKVDKLTLSRYRE